MFRNVVPIHLYKKASKDYNMTHVQPLQTAIVAYGGARLPVIGQVRIRVWRGDYKCLLDCKLVDSTAIRPLLGRKACVGMKSMMSSTNREQETHLSMLWTVEARIGQTKIYVCFRLPDRP